jgi:hypothetical protein
MQIKRRIDPNRKLVFTTITGEMTMNEVREDLARLAPGADYDPGLPELVDMRNATTALTTSELLQLAGTAKHHTPTAGRGRRALLLSSDLMYGLYRMFAGFANGGTTDFGVFRDEAAALAWLEGKEVEGDDGVG